MSIRSALVLTFLTLAPGALLAQDADAAPATTQTAPDPTTQQQPAGSFGETVRATAVTVTVDVRDAQGSVPSDLSPQDLVVLEDGVEMPVLELERIGDQGTATLVPESTLPATAGEAPEEAGVPSNEAGQSTETGAPEFIQPPMAGADEAAWQVVVYIDSPTVSSQTVQAAAAQLAERSQELAGLGSIEIVLADPSPAPLLAASRNPEEIAAAFTKLAEKGIGHNEIARLRRDFVSATDADNLDELSRGRVEGPLAGQRGSGAPGSGSPFGRDAINRAGGASSGSSLPSGASAFQRQNLIRTTARQEYQLLARQRTLLVDWLALIERPRRPHALILVSDGFDTDPTEFYMSYLRDTSQASIVESELQDFRSGPAFENSVDVVAAAGWQVFPIALSQPGAAGANTAEQSGRGRFRGFNRESRAAASGSGLSAFLLRAPLQPLQVIAEETGGSVAVTPDQVLQLVSGLGERFRLTYQVPRDPDGATHALEIRSRRPDLSVKVQKQVSTASPDAMMAARARHVLQTGESDAGELAVAVSGRLEEDPQAPKEAVVLMLSYDANLAPVAAQRAALDASELRVTMAVELPDGRIVVTQERPQARDLSSDRRFVARVPLRLPKGTKGVAVAIDDVSTGSWGGGVWSPKG